jgi:hypothetical protein
MPAQQPGGRAPWTLLVALVLILTGCARASSPVPTAGDATVGSVAPSAVVPSTSTETYWIPGAIPDSPAVDVGPAPGPGVTVVVGTGRCSMTLLSDETVDGIRTIREHFVCDEQLSDPRVSGTEDFVAITRFADAPPGAIWTAETTVTTDRGTWHGDALGVVDLEGVLPFARGVVPFNYGEAHFIGEGPYAGLEYHYYISGTNEMAGLTGWIVSSD